MAAGMRRVVRALWLIDSLSLGGAETLALSLARSFQRVERAGSRMEIQVAALKSDLPGIPIARDGDRSVWRLNSRGLRDRRTLGRLVNQARDFRPQLIHAHLTDATIWGEIVARRLGVPWAVTLHVEPGVRTSLGPVSFRLRAWLERRALRHATGVAGVSKAVTRAWEDSGGLSGRPLNVLPNGVDTERFQPADSVRRARLRSALHIPPNRAVISTVAVLRAGKGIDTFIDAIRVLAGGGSNVQALIVGEGPEGDRLRASATDLGDRIRFLGCRSDVEAILSASDFFVLASEREALPTVLLEAMASGLPIVATEVGGVPEAVTDETSGLLVPAGSVDDLAAALARLLADPELARALASAGRRRATEQFSLSAWENRLAEWYLDLLEIAPGGQPEPSPVGNESELGETKVVGP